MAQKKTAKKTTKTIAKRADGDAGVLTKFADEAVSKRIDQKIRELGDWRGKTLERARRIIRAADPEIVEELKWMGTPVWSREGIITTGETYKSVVKLTFAKGASLKDPHELFNSSLEGNVRRAIDIHEGEAIDEKALTELVRAAVALNLSKSGKSKSAPRAQSGKSAKPVLLSGGNPQIAMGDGDGPVQAYIAAMPGWKRDIGRQLDALIARTVPGVRKAVKWNSPFYGVEGQGWFLDFHCFTHYVKVAFFRGSALRPPPPGESKVKDVRYLDLRKDDELDEKLLASWIRQASELPGWVP